MQTSARAVVEALSSKRFRYANESDLQKGVALVLDDLCVAYDRETRLSGRDRIDFMVDGCIGIEVKVDGSLTALTRQVHRYVQHASLSSLVIVTTRAKHRDLPSEISGKRVDIVWISGVL